MESVIFPGCFLFRPSKTRIHVQLPGLLVTGKLFFLPCHDVFDLKFVIVFIALLLIVLACSREDHLDQIPFDNPKIAVDIPTGFPAFNRAVEKNWPTQYGVELGEKLFNEKRFSGNNTISCASCHQQTHAFADQDNQSVGIHGRTSLRNAPSIQNLAFMKFYNWDGNILELEKQVLVPIITHEEMNSSIVEAIEKIGLDQEYQALFERAFGDTDITPERIYSSIAQYEYTLISANSKYDRVRDQVAHFTPMEAQGYRIFKQKCASCHSGELFTDQTFRNIGFPLNPNAEEAGRARVTGDPMDAMRFRVPSLRNVAYTAPYGSFGQFASLEDVLNYFDQGVIPADNLDPIFKANANRIPLTQQEKQHVIAFLNTLSDPTFVGK
ncbi:MAG: cytochrome-c peroxidase [Sphingobacterium sp.]